MACSVVCLDFVKWVAWHNLEYMGGFEVCLTCSSHALARVRVPGSKREWLHTQSACHSVYVDVVCAAVLYRPTWQKFLFSGSCLQELGSSAGF
jgi:hypothetical protein